MKKTISKISLAVMSLLPASALAYTAPAYTAPDVLIKDPSTTSVASILGLVIDWVLLLVGGVTVLFIIYSGIQYVTSAGNKERAESAKKTLTYAVIGLVIIVLADVIVRLVMKLPTDVGITK
jgi:lysylphosphatidylglycerol synthetase-like protein (DUF2156 family)